MAKTYKIDEELFEATITYVVEKMRIDAKRYGYGRNEFQVELFLRKQPLLQRLKDIKDKS